MENRLSQVKTVIKGKKRMQTQVRYDHRVIKIKLATKQKWNKTMIQ